MSGSEARALRGDGGEGQAQGTLAAKGAQAMDAYVSSVGVGQVVRGGEAEPVGQEGGSAVDAEDLV